MYIYIFIYNIYTYKYILLCICMCIYTAYIMYYFIYCCIHAYKTIINVQILE